jgi:hypothetical protein
VKRAGPSAGHFPFPACVAGSTGERVVVAVSSARAAYVDRAVLTHATGSKSHLLNQGCTVRGTTRDSQEVSHG